MFNKLKQFKDLREQGKKLQGALEGESETTEAFGGKVSITIDGNLNISAIKLDPEILTPNNQQKLESSVKDAHNNGIKKMQRKIAMKMQQMGGFNMPGMS
jgi:hypothetical protein